MASPFAPKATTPPQPSSASILDMLIRRKRLLQKINQLGKTEHTEILGICKQHNVNVTETRLNGVFFNLTTLPDNVFVEIEDFVNYCHANKSALDEYDQKLQECKFFKACKPPQIVTYGVNEPLDIKKNNLKDLIETVDKDTSKKVNDFLKKLNIASAASDAAGMAGSTRARNSNRYMVLKKKFAKRVSWADVNATTGGGSTSAGTTELTKDE
jgi:hypothetical protein